MKNKYFKNINNRINSKNIKDVFFDNKYTLMQYSLALLIPLAIIFTVFKIVGIAPFGDDSLLCMDLWGQYFPMYMQQYSNDSLSEFLYSFNGGLGFNFFAQSAYYTNSIFFILFRFFEPEQLIDVLDVICALKIGLSSVTCFAFLRKKLDSKSNFLLAGSISYAFCAYALAYISQPMWTDSVILLPLILIGLEKLINEKKSLMYALILAFAIISNFYIGFAMCIFMVLYFAVQMIMKLKIKIVSHHFRFEGLNEIGSCVVRFVVFSLLAGGMAAIVIIPILKAINQTIASDSQFPDAVKWYHSFAEYVNAMMPETALSFEFGVPNIATGMAFFILIPLFFFNKKIGIKEKLVYGGFLLILYCSMNTNVLDYIWHGFHFPNQLPGRWTFIFSLMIVLIGCKSIIKYKGLSYINILCSWIVGAFFVYFSRYAYQTDILTNTEYADLVKKSICIITCIGLILGFLIYARKMKSYEKISQVVMIVLALICVVEVSSNVSTIYERELKRADKVSYNDTLLEIRKYGEVTNSDKTDFYRVGTNGNFTFNTGMLGDYRDISYYSSTMDASTYKLLESLGNRVYAKNVSSVYNCNSPVMNSIFSVKKIVDRKKDLILPGAQYVTTENGSNIYENPTSLGLIFPVDNEMVNWSISNQPKGIENQNNMLNYMVGQELNVFEKITSVTSYMENATVDENDDWNNNYFDAAQNNAIIRYTFTCQSDGPVYVENNFRAGTISAVSTSGTINIGVDERFKCIGSYKAGDVININIDTGETYRGLAGINLYTFNEEKWQQAYDMLNGNFDVESFKTTKIKGKITMNSSGMVCSSIIQDGGWSIYCDGKKVETRLMGDALVGFFMEKGEHVVEFKYHVPGLRFGIVLSVFCLGVAIFLAKRKTKNILIKK